MAFEGSWVSSKIPSDTETRELLRGKKEKSISWTRNHWFVFKANQWLCTKRKRWVRGQTCGTCARSSSSSSSMSSLSFVWLLLLFFKLLLSQDWRDCWWWSKLFEDEGEDGVRLWSEFICCRPEFDDVDDLASGEFMAIRFSLSLWFESPSSVTRCSFGGIIDCRPWMRGSNFR